MGRRRQAWPVHAGTGSGGRPAEVDLAGASLARTRSGIWAPVEQPGEEGLARKQLAGKFKAPVSSCREAFQHGRGLTQTQKWILLRPAAGCVPPSSGHHHCSLCPVPRGAPHPEPRAVCARRAPLCPGPSVPQRAPGCPRVLDGAPTPPTPCHLSLLSRSVWRCLGIRVRGSVRPRPPRPRERLLVPEVCAFLWSRRLARGVSVPPQCRPARLGLTSSGARASLGLSHSEEALGKRPGPQRGHRKTLQAMQPAHKGTDVWPRGASKGGPHGDGDSSGCLALCPLPPSTRGDPTAGVRGGSGPKQVWAVVGGGRAGGLLGLSCSRRERGGHHCYCWAGRAGPGRRGARQGW